MQFMMPQGKGMRGNGGGGGGGGGSGGRSSGRAPYSSSQEGIEAFDGPRGSAADADRSDGAIEVDDGHRRHHDNHDHHQGTAKVQEEALRGRFSYLDIADRVKCLLTNTDDHSDSEASLRSPRYEERRQPMETTMFSHSNHAYNARNSVPAGSGGGGGGGGSNRNEALTLCPARHEDQRELAARRSGQNFFLRREAPSFFRSPTASSAAAAACAFTNAVDMAAAAAAAAAAAPSSFASAPSSAPGSVGSGGGSSGSGGPKSYGAVSTGCGLVRGRSKRKVYMKPMRSTWPTEEDGDEAVGEREEVASGDSSGPKPREDSVSSSVRSQGEGEGREASGDREAGGEEPRGVSNPTIVADPQLDRRRRLRLVPHPPGPPFRAVLGGSAAGQSAHRREASEGDSVEKASGSGPGSWRSLLRRRSSAPENSVAASDDDSSAGGGGGGGGGCKTSAKGTHPGVDSDGDGGGGGGGGGSGGCGGGGGGGRGRSRKSSAQAVPATGGGSRGSGGLTASEAVHSIGDTDGSDDSRGGSGDGDGGGGSGGSGAGRATAQAIDAVGGDTGEGGGSSDETDTEAVRPVWSDDDDGDEDDEVRVVMDVDAEPPRPALRMMRGSSQRVKSVGGTGKVTALRAAAAAASDAAVAAAAAASVAASEATAAAAVATATADGTLGGAPPRGGAGTTGLLNTGGLPKKRSRKKVRFDVPHSSDSCSSRSPTPSPRRRGGGAVLVEMSWSPPTTVPDSPPSPIAVDEKDWWACDVKVEDDFEVRGDCEMADRKALWRRSSSETGSTQVTPPSSANQNSTDGSTEVGDGERTVRLASCDGDADGDGGSEAPQELLPFPCKGGIKRVEGATASVVIGGGVGGSSCTTVEPKKASALEADLWEATDSPTSESSSGETLRQRDYSESASLAPSSSTLVEGNSKNADSDDTDRDSSPPPALPPAEADADAGEETPATASPSGAAVAASSYSIALPELAEALEAVAAEEPEPVAATVAPAALSHPVSFESGKDCLERMHHLLTSTFALMDTEDSKRGVASAPLAAARWAGGGSRERDLAAVAGTPPLLWVVRYVDRSRTYGLGFLLSNGSIVVHFKDSTKMVLGPDGIVFEYVSRLGKPFARDDEEAAEETDDGVGGGGGGGGGDRRGDGSRKCASKDNRSRHTIKSYPPDLAKKVSLLHRFRKHLHSTQTEKGKRSGVTVLTVAAVAAVAAVVSATAAVAPAGGGDASAALGRGHGKEGDDWTIVDDHRRTRHSSLFLLSNSTAQVVFADASVLLLSEEARLITFIDADGQLETLSLRRVLGEQRETIIKHLRYSKDLIYKMLARGSLVRS